ncbi:MAG TPA: cob(I)yrinic acid a,c-diamide adenosyltransferase [Clostridiaceae bacterium]|nr:cob(I)yrinic acid a,c-diamide adenosyltransferase [Clostridiaceae bacterium]
MEKGYVHVYTGNGKGKTTAALGLSLRAVCAGKKVFFGQFMKGMDYSELDAGKYLPGFDLQQFGTDSFIFDKPCQDDINAAREGLRSAEEVLVSGEYDLVVLDEANLAVHYGLITVEELIGVLQSRASHVETVVTGRYAHCSLIEKADLVTEMMEIKHYYNDGVMAREGIEF